MSFTATSLILWPSGCVLFLAAAKTLINFVNKVKVIIFCCKEILTHTMNTTFHPSCPKNTPIPRKMQSPFVLIIHFIHPFPSHPLYISLKFLSQADRNSVFHDEFIVMDIWVFNTKLPERRCSLHGLYNFCRRRRLQAERHDVR